MLLSTCTLDADNAAVARHFEEEAGSIVLEVGANDGPLANYLANAGCQVLGVDLRPPINGSPRPNYHRLQGDFCEMMEKGLIALNSVDAVVCASAIEHFGLGTYPNHSSVRDDDYDIKASKMIFEVLRPGGRFYLTVPYGNNFIVNRPHWRVYNKQTLQDRLIGQFEIVHREFFKSAGCDVPDDGGFVTEENADRYAGEPPHLTVFAKLRKPCSQP